MRSHPGFSPPAEAMPCLTTEHPHYLVTIGNFDDDDRAICPPQRLPSGALAQLSGPARARDVPGLQGASTPSFGCYCILDHGESALTPALSVLVILTAVVEPTV